LLGFGKKNLAAVAKKASLPSVRGLLPQTVARSPQPSRSAGVSVPVWLVVLSCLHGVLPLVGFRFDLGLHVLCVSPGPPARGVSCSPRFQFRIAVGF